MTGGAIIIAIFSILAKLLGLIRDRLLAANFGAGDILDAYYAAFKLPDLIFNTLVLGALSVAFVPVFINLINSFNVKENKNKNTSDELNSWQLTSAVINIVFIVLGVLAVLFFIFARQITPLIAPGFQGEKLYLTIAMTRIMLISIMFFGISNVLSSVLQAKRRFTMFALAPVMYNLGIIIGIILFVHWWGPIGLAWGVVLGAILHMLIQIPAVIRLGFRWQAVLALKNKALRKIGRLMLPRTFGLIGNQVNQLVITIIASTLLSGSLAVFNLAFNLQSMPIGIFAVSLAVAAFPLMSESLSRNDLPMFLHRFSSTIRKILFLIIPTSFFIIALRAQIVRLVLGTGKFDWQDTVMTAQALGIFAMSLFAQGLIPLLARAFYAFQNTKTPVLISLISIIVNISGSIILAPKWGVLGLVTAFSLANILQVILLITSLYYKMGNLDEKKIILSLFKIMVATLGALIPLQAVKYVIGNAVNMYTYLGVLWQFIGAGLSGLTAYLIIVWILDIEEIKLIKDKLNSFLKKEKATE